MRKRKFFKLVAVLAGLLLIGVAGVVMADTDTSDLTITVSAIDDITITGTQSGITLSALAGETDLTQAAASTGGLLNYTHNSATNKEITAEVTTDPTGNNITLTVTVSGGAGAVEIYTSGSPTAALDVYTPIVAGTITDATITYNVTAATVTGTPISGSPYVFQITFTSQDVS